MKVARAHAIRPSWLSARYLADGDCVSSLGLVVECPRTSVMRADSLLRLTLRSVAESYVPVATTRWAFKSSSILPCGQAARIRPHAPQARAAPVVRIPVVSEVLGFVLP